MSRIRARCVLVACLCVASAAFAQTATVSPIAQTAALARGPLLPHLWVNPTDPAQSRIFVADSQGDLDVYALDGTAVGTGLPGPLSGVGDVAVAYDVPIAGTHRDFLVVGGTDKTVSFVAIDGSTGQLGSSNAGTFSVLASSGSGIDRIAAYESPLTNTFYVFVADRSGNIEDWQFGDDGTGHLVGSQIARTGLSLGEQLGGMVADESDERVYLTGTNTGLYRFGAEPNGSQLALLDSTSGALHLVAPVGGVAIYRAHGAGYLLVGDNGSSDVAVYLRAPTGASDYVTRFLIGSGNGIDGVQNPIGIDVMSFGLGGAFPSGLFVAHDNVTSDGGSDVKLVSWGAVASAAGLAAPDSTDNPHSLPDAGISDGGVTDGGVPDGGTVPVSHHTGCTATGGPLGGLALLALLALPLVRRRRMA